ncbi:Novel immunogenic protein NIP-2 [Trichuris trichiura]|uniref:Novel immunogenic protein NIP-2 n=1 Tax=Trichuris trichiura TaxID=36087 RepID=A0A077YXD3_TRITR|nr:Novel immunogenic protein NIP-2 [Trichuris trichiura]
MVVKYRAIKQFGRYNTRRFKLLYESWLKEAMPPFEVPADLKALNVKIHDPNLIHCLDLTTNPLIVDGQTPVASSETCFTFDGTESLAEGVKQALNLIKAVGHVGLPQKITEKLSDVQFYDLDSALTKFIMQANKWSSTLLKLPVRRDPTVWWFNWPRYYGIPSVRKSSILFDNFLRHSFVLMQQNGVRVNQRLFRNECVKDFVRKDDELLCFSVKPYIALWKRSLLPPLSDPNEVTETRHEKLVDIHPVHPLVDLRKESISEIRSIYPTAPPSFPIIHTTFIVKDVDYRYPWTKNELAGNAILSCFANAIAVANKLYGSSPIVLPTPIVCQCVQCCENNFDFCVLQLNTTKVGGSDGVKNIVWHDTSKLIICSCSQCMRK